MFNQVIRLNICTIIIRQRLSSSVSPNLTLNYAQIMFKQPIVQQQKKKWHSHHKLFNNSNIIFHGDIVKLYVQIVTFTIRIYYSPLSLYKLNF